MEEEVILLPFVEVEVVEVLPLVEVVLMVEVVLQVLLLVVGDLMQYRQEDHKASHHAN